MLSEEQLRKLVARLNLDQLEALPRPDLPLREEPLAHYFPLALLVVSEKKGIRVEHIEGIAMTRQTLKEHALCLEPIDRKLVEKFIQALAIEVHVLHVVALFIEARLRKLSGP